MATLEEVREINNRLRTQGLVISRLPEPTRSQFIEFANGEFAGDYGCTLVYIFDCFKHYQQIINTQDTKLDYIITMLKNQTQPKIEGKKLPKMLGRDTEKEVDEQR
jgi:hypothetical protein